MTDQPHPGHHDCLPEIAAKLTEQRFIALVEEHEELHDLLRFSAPTVIAMLITEEEQ